MVKGNRTAGPVLDVSLVLVLQMLILVPLAIALAERVMSVLEGGVGR
jgi:hypothetical protein